MATSRPRANDSMVRFTVGKLGAGNTVYLRRLQDYQAHRPLAGVRSAASCHASAGTAWRSTSPAPARLDVLLRSQLPGRGHPTPRDRMGQGLHGRHAALVSRPGPAQLPRTRRRRCPAATPTTQATSSPQTETSIRAPQGAADNYSSPISARSSRTFSDQRIVTGDGAPQAGYRVAHQRSGVAVAS